LLSFAFFAPFAVNPHGLPDLPPNINIKLTESPVAWVIINAIRYIYQYYILNKKLHSNAEPLFPLVFVFITQHLSILEDMKGDGKNLPFFGGT
jgi:hypothetical protein